MIESKDVKLQRRIQRYGWDRAASYYEDSWRRQLEPAQKLLLEMAALQPGERVLDVACGTGLITFRAAAAVGPRGFVAGSDISMGMIDEASAIAAHRGVANVSFERVDAESLDFPDNHFDVALCSLGLMYVSEPVTALRRMHRPLRPGGRAAVAVWGRRERCGWAGIFPVVDARVESDVCPMFFQLGTGDALAHDMQMAGFSDIEVERITVRLEYASEEEVIEAAFMGGPVALAYSRFDERTRVEAHAEYLQSIERYRIGQGYSVPGEFVVAAGFKREAAAAARPAETTIETGWDREIEPYAGDAVRS
jgi:ubiquinone/menaquinone biosynthesis C-methylase UbiE